MFINDKFVEIISCSKLMLAKVVQFVHPPTFEVSLLAKVMHYVHPSLFKPLWMEEEKWAKVFKQSACWEATQLNQICYLFLLLLYFSLFFFWFIYFNYECMCLGSSFLFACQTYIGDNVRFKCGVCMLDLHWGQCKI